MLLDVMGPLPLREQTVLLLMWGFAALLCLGLSSTPARGQSLPSIDVIESEITRLNAVVPKDDTQIQQYQTLLIKLKGFKPLRAERDKYRDLISQFPQQRERLSQKITEAAQLDIFQIHRLSGYSDLSQAMASLQAAVSEWRSADKANSDRRKQLNASRTTLPKRLAALSRDIDQASLAPNGSRDLLQQWLAMATLQSLVLKKEAVASELQSLDERTELLRLEQQLLDQKIQLATPLLIDLQDRLTQVEQASVRTLIDAIRIQADLPDNQVAGVRETVDDLKDLALELEQALAEIDRTRILNQRLESEQQTLLEEQQQIKDNLNWLRQSTAFGASIRVQLQRLPAHIDDGNIPDQLAGAHIRKYELSQKRNDLAMDEAVAGRGERHSIPEGQGKRHGLEKQVVERLIQEYDKLIIELGRLQSVKSQYVLEIATARTFLKEQQLWIRTNLPLWHNITRMDADIWFGARTPLKMMLERTTQSQQLIVLGLLIVYTLACFLLGKRLNRYAALQREQYRKVFGHPLKDKFRYTVVLFLVAAIRAAILPLWYGLTALSIYWLWPMPTSGDLSALILASSLGLFVLELIYVLSVNHGVLALHLSWPQEICGYLHCESKRLRLPFMLLLLLLFCSELISGEKEAEASRVLFLLLIAGMTYIYAFLLRKDRLPTVLLPPFDSGVPLLLLRVLLVGSFVAIMVMAILGLYLAAWALLSYQQLTLFIMLGVLLAYQVGERWLKLEHRQLNYQRLLARREELIAQQQEHVEEPPELTELREALPEVEERCLNSEQISEQSLTLLRGLSLIGFVIAMLTLWSNALEMASWLNKVVVWQVSEMSKDGVVVVDITLQSLLYAAITLLVTGVAVRNLPGILELLVLRRLEMSPGTGYAITTLLRYLLLMVGLFTAFAIMGFQWSSLQWLVAAFGVGLGFGLQEIFANFISGLIILFERPIRIGDIVTINDLTGQISKINTRATTIIDWDNKEIVVPNKAFITEKLINWTLTDPVNRVVVPVGVAYGTDIELVERLLYQVAEEHPLVLQEPTPSVFFLSFGQSSLQFELRVYIPNIDHLLPTIHLINKSIDTLFRQHNIEIAFPQMDLHVRDWPPSKGDGETL